MNILKSIKNFFAPPARSVGSIAWVSVECGRCGETLRCRVNLYNDPSIQYGADESDVTYFLRKVVVGEQHCYQKVELELTFDKSRRLTEHKVVGGKFLEISYGN